jgi:hypothetical protein
MATVMALTLLLWGSSAGLCNAGSRADIHQDEPPGQVLFWGYVQHQLRDGSWTFLSEAKVVLCDDDPEPEGAAPGSEDDCFDSDDGDPVNVETYANPWGFYSLPVYQLRSDDDQDGGPEDLYVRFETTRRLVPSATGALNVTHLPGALYAVGTASQNDTPAGTYNSVLDWSNSDMWHQALWLFDDMKRASTWFAAHDGDIPLVFRDVNWESGVLQAFNCASSCYIPVPGVHPSGVFISDEAIESPDVVLHELGHSYLHSRVGSIAFYLDSLDYWRCFVHRVWEGSSEKCAFAEGWGHFLALVANESLTPGPDHCFDHMTWQPCTDWHDDLENQTWGIPAGAQHGYAVEGRVAGAMYDIEDANIDGADTLGNRFADIWWLLGQNIYPDDPEDTARVLYNHYASWLGPALAPVLKAIYYQNTLPQAQILMPAAPAEVACVGALCEP